MCTSTQLLALTMGIEMRQSWRARVLLTTTLAVLACVVLSGCASVRGPIVIGYLGGLSGRTSDLGDAGRDGALLAVEEANLAGGVDGRELELLPADDAQDVTKAASAFRELEAADAVAVIGPMTSAIAVTVTPIADELEVPLVSPTTSTDELTGRADWFYRLYPDNSSAARKLAAVVHDRLGHTRVAMIYDLANRAHTETWARNFTDELTLLGGSVTSSETITSGELGTYDIAVDRALSSEPQCVFVLANALDTARLATLLRGAGFEGHVITSEWSATEVVIGYGGRAVEGMMFLNTFDRESTTSGYQGFAKRFRERFGYEAGFASVHAYDATRLVISQLDSDPTRAALRGRLDGLRSFDAIQGGLKLDATGDVERDYFLMTIRDGVFVRVE
ncbi:MAG: amino acid ABC transporter substrate-binding protein [Actinobacteria bacterium]|nr:MAG: amino acid ABC transporter substrate-binding protein [Actinomycetota bacterium]